MIKTKTSKAFATEGTEIIEVSGSTKDERLESSFEH
jgi:hypothetical protein